jgi:hypothetical protein
MFEIEVKLAEELSDEKLDDVIATVEAAGGMIGGGGDEFVLAADNVAVMFMAVAQIAKVVDIRAATFPCSVDDEFMEPSEEQVELTNQVFWYQQF